jgi:hypothetical protein
VASSFAFATTSSKGWIVTLTIAKNSLLAGTSIPAIVSIVNRTGRTIRDFGCAVDATFAVSIGNAKLQFAPADGFVGCLTEFHKGANVFHAPLDVGEFTVWLRAQFPLRCRREDPKVPTPDWSDSASLGWRSI